MIYSAAMNARSFQHRPRSDQRFGILVLGSLLLVLTFPSLAQADRFEKARKKLNEALKHCEQGSVLYNQGKYRAALSGDRDELYWHQALGVALEKQGDLQGTLGEHRLASQLSPDDSSLHIRYYILDPPTMTVCHSQVPATSVEPSR